MDIFRILNTLEKFKATLKYLMRNENLESVKNIQFLYFKTQKLYAYTDEEEEDR